MNKLLTTTFNELTKIFTRKKYIVLLVTNGLISIGIGLVSSSNRHISFNGFSLELPDLHFTVLPLMASLVFPLMIFLLVADLFGAEWETGMIKAVLLRPVSRPKIYLAKHFAVFLYVLANLLFVFVVCISMRFLLGGEVRHMGSGLLAYFLTMLPLSACLTVASFFTSCCRTATMSFFVNVLVYAACRGISFFFSKAGAVLFTSYTNFFRLWIGSGVHMAVAMRVSCLLFSYCIIFSLVGFLFFDQREI